MNKTINGLKSENVALNLKNQRLEDFTENLQNEISLKKSEICHLQETLILQRNSLEEKFRADAIKLEKMDKLTLEFKKIHDDYEELRLEYNRNTYEAMVTKSMKNDQIDELKNKNESLRNDIALLTDKTKYLCRRRETENINQQQDRYNACKARFQHRGGNCHRGRQQGHRGQYSRNRRH
jgi:hypothetical protein